MSIQNWTNFFSFLAVVTLLVGAVMLIKGKEAIMPALEAPVLPSNVNVPVTNAVKKAPITRATAPVVVAPVVQATNPAACAQLSNAPAGARDKCYVGVASYLKDASLCSRILVTGTGDASNYTKQSDYNDCMFRVSLALNNAATCQQIDDKNDRYFCLIQLAGAKHDKTLCDLLPATADGDVFWNRASCTVQVDECLKPGVNCAR